MTPRRARIPFTGEDPPTAGIDGRSGEVAAYYIGNHHRLIHRHTESIAINADQTARWTLKIDFELPEAPEARCNEHNGEVLFLFPLLFLRKAQGRTGFEARNEQGAVIPLLNRKDSDEISANAAARSAMRLLDEARAESPELPELPEASLRFVFERICKWRPYVASVILSKLKHDFDEGVKKVWKDAGLTEDLELLVDHSLVWVPLRGLPGERRVIEVAHDTELSRRPLLRWHFGKLKVPENRLRWWRRWRRRKQIESNQVLDAGQEEKYGRTARRVSLSVLGERLAQPLGWMPIEFDFPTIYTRRCDSYHFEMTCPGGLKPRGVKVALDKEGGHRDREEQERQEEGSGRVGGSREAASRREEEEQRELEHSARTTMGSKAAHVYLPGGRKVGDIVLRATVGINGDAFPILWVLMGAITTMMLWSLVALNPSWLIEDFHSHNEIAAGVLLIVPALLGALIVGSDEKAESKLLSGARILLLVTGLCCAGAAVVLTGIHPLKSKPQATWAVCASIATAAMIPLVTSWLLSLDSVWRARETLNTSTRQWIALFALGALTVALVLILRDAGGDTIVRAGLASCLLLLSVTMTLLASNRLPLALEANRKFLSVGAMLLAAACLVIGCIELQRICAPDAAWQKEVENAGLGILPVALFSGLGLWAVTRIFGLRREELSISPAVGQALIAEERIRELRRLREIDARPDLNWGRIVEGVKNLRFTLDDDEADERPRGQGEIRVEPAGRTEGDWSAAEHSSTGLPRFEPDEFAHLVSPDEAPPEIDAAPKEVERLGVEEIAKREGVPRLEVERALLNQHVDALLVSAGKDDPARGPWDRFKSRLPGRQ